MPKIRVWVLSGWVGLAGVLSQEPALPVQPQEKAGGRLNKGLSYHSNTAWNWDLLGTFRGGQNTELRGLVLQRRDIYMGFF